KTDIFSYIFIKTNLGGMLHVGPNGELYTEDPEPEPQPLKIGPQVGIEIGPQIGPQSGPQIGPKIPSLKSLNVSNEYTWAQQFNWEENQKHAEYHEHESYYQQPRNPLIISKKEVVGEEF